MSERPKSQMAYDDLCMYLPGGVNSPVRAGGAVEALPLVTAYGKKDKIYDVDGNGYIDYCQSWGALIHGHAPSPVIKEVQKAMRLGTTFGTTTMVEGELAKKITTCMPSIEKIRFVSSGTESTMSAIRLCRGYTKKDLIIKFNGNYHGHADFFLVKAGSGVLHLPESSSSGIPEDFVKLTLSLPYNNVETFTKTIQQVKNRLAAVIVEPIAGNMGLVPATQQFLQALRDETKKIGALLVFDEVITGFRLGLGGAQSLYNITPDLTCLGKIIGGGFPAAAFGGKKAIMDHLAPLGAVYQAGTLSGNPIAMQAGLTTLSLLDKHVYQELQEKTELLTKPIQEWIAKKNLPLALHQVGSMFTLFFGKRSINNAEDAKELDVKTYARFFKYMLENHIYFPPAQQEAAFVSTAHTTAHLKKTRDIILKFLKLF